MAASLPEGERFHDLSTNDKSPILFSDFDGTITCVDTVDLILETFARPEWMDIEQEWVEGQITARQCLERQMSCVSAGAGELEELLRTIDIDPGFKVLAHRACELKIPLVVFSDGFDWIIERIFSLNGLDPIALGIRMFSSHLAFPNGTPICSFPFSNDCAHGCGTCKPEVIRRLSPPHSMRIIIGDGRSDLAALTSADLVFAKGWLSRYCFDHGIAHQSFSNLNEVLSFLSLQRVGMEAPQI
jgi:2-hydroxy-3-keto-5-methylthiopentenyl-1-phosphate phosphatase